MTAKKVQPTNPDTKPTNPDTNPEAERKNLALRWGRKLARKNNVARWG